MANNNGIVISTNKQLIMRENGGISGGKNLQPEELPVLIVRRLDSIGVACVASVKMGRYSSGL